ncbi:MAG: hypothetical protein RLZZ334_900, partial [Actinomycetota bacterium]
SLLFVLGFSLVFVSYGALFGGLGNQLSANEELISRILGILTIFLGFVFYGRFPFSPTIRPKMRTTGGLLGAPMLGVLFGIGWTPCIGPALAAVQTLAFQESSAVRGAILSFGYCLHGQVSKTSFTYLSPWRCDFKNWWSLLDYNWLIASIRFLESDNELSSNTYL